MRKKIFIFLWILLITISISIASLFIAISKGWIGYMPSIDALQNPIDKYATQILSEDGVLLGTWAKHDNRIFVNYNEVSPNIYKALIATEDARYYDHSGIDFIALMRAIVKTGIFRNNKSGGGSTITQQLAKQLYSTKAKSSFQRILQKPIEWVIAVELERLYTKNEILVLYLNYFDFLNNAVGIKTAANTYFNKQPSELSITEAATLIGMCQNPALYNPIRYPDRCKQRRNVVLSQMLKYDYITETEYQQLITTPLVLNFKRRDHKTGLAPYLREYLRLLLTASKPDKSNYWDPQNYSDDSLQWETNPLYGWCKKNTKSNGEPYDIYEDGLKVFTSINSKMQLYAEEAVKDHIKNYLQPLFNQEKKGSPNYPFSSSLTTEQIQQILQRSIKQSDRYIQMKKEGYSQKEILNSFYQKVPMTLFSYHGPIDTIMTPLDSIKYYKGFLRASFVAMEPQTGLVKAYVGNVDYTYFQYDMVTKGRRQIGSTIKPFVYALAMERGYTPCDEVENIQRSYQIGTTVWTPRNSSTERYGDMVSLRWALAQSNNWISVHLLNQLSPKDLVSLLRKIGFQDQHIYPSLSLALGTCDASLEEMASAYTAFANKGLRSLPLFVTRIEGANGKVLANFTPRIKEAITEESTYKMLDLLKGVIDNGTSRRIRFRYNIHASMGGKTGTTNRNSDGWFMAILPRLVCASWVGGEDRDIRFNNMAYGQGASSALPIFGIFMNKVFQTPHLGYSQNESFNIPPDYNACGIDSLSNEPTLFDADLLIE